MARMELNRSGDMEVFVRVVELGGLSAAARSFRMTPSAVSKLLARLEARLGARLVNRSTRKIQLTPEGAVFHERSQRLLRELEEAEREVSPGVVPRGRLRVSSNVPFGIHCLVPLMPELLALHPHVTLDLTLSDAVVDLLEVRADVAIRTGPLRGSRLVARKLGESRMIVVASPAYLARHGKPKKPADLARHNRLVFCFARHSRPWPFHERPGHAAITPLAPSGNAVVGDGEAMRGLALAGLGIARLAKFHIGPDLAAGTLVPLLETYSPRDTESVHAVFLNQDGQLAARTRAFIDFLVARVNLS